jgi:hypothetical protein
MICRQNARMGSPNRFTYLFPEEKEIQDDLGVDGKTLTFEPQNRLQAPYSYGGRR